MIAVICLLAFLTVGGCTEQLPTRGEIESSINRTIEEVERMVSDDPSLPRLSRKQIVDILFNITSMDMNYYEKSVEKTREDYQRALMIVMPHSSNDATGDSLKELYTKAPLVKIVEDAPEGLDGAMEYRNDGEKGVEARGKHYGNHRETFAEVGTQESLRSISSKDKNTEPAPEKFSFDLEGLGTIDDGGPSGRPGSKNPPAEKASPARKTNLEIIYSTSVTRKPTTKLPMSPDKADNGFRPTMPSTRSTQNILTSDQWRYNAPPSSATQRPARPSGGSRNRHGSTPAPFLPTMMTETSARDKVTLPSLDSQASRSTVAPQGRRNALPHRSMEESRIVNDKPASLYVTPMTSTTSTKADLPSTSPSHPETTKAPTHMREEVQDLLASIGLRPKTAGNDEKSINKIERDEDKLFGANFQIPESTNAIPASTSGLTSIGNDSPSIISQNTFQRTPQDVKKGVNNLSPDVQLLFQRFGLQSTRDRETDSKEVTTEKPRVRTTKTSFWNNFKPIPTSRVKDEGMRDFLAKFGLGIQNDRREKAVMTRQQKVERKPSLIEAVPGNMKGILENIGLITRSQRQPPISATTDSPELHVFKPHETSFDNEIQREKINHLLDTVKMVQDGKADVSAVQTAAKELLESTKKLKNGPDPLSIEEILKIYNDDIKNEIKRQQDPKDLEDLAISETTNSTSTTKSPEVEMSSILTDSSASSSDSSATSTESSIDLKDLESPADFGTTENSNVDSLADSFGGITAAPDPVLPTPRKTGLYFLVDWNTFLEVGEEGKDRVNLRFQPKAGDRTRFLPVTVP